VRGTEPSLDIPGWIEAGHLLGEGIRLVFTAREGGCSPPPYDSLNLAYHTGDDPANVLLNRRAVATRLGIPAEDFIYLEQVHGLRVGRAVSADTGIPPREFHPDFAASDGAFSTEAGLVLAVLTADCVPLALTSPYNRVALMLHAGWRGTLEDIVAAGLDILQNELGVRSSECAAVMGPAVGPCCYGVDKGRAAVFVERYGEGSGVVMEEKGYHLDLKRANRLNLLRAGVADERIWEVGGCTCCDRRYFSYRRDGVTGRQGSFIYLEKKA
jgi:purine-nucleoside/S-methyl-5'-thioadenosine phosphorylase / adenosine deaminase